MSSATTSAQTLSPFFFYSYANHRDLHSFPTRRSSDLETHRPPTTAMPSGWRNSAPAPVPSAIGSVPNTAAKVVIMIRSEEHTSELQSRPHLVCRLLLEKKKNKKKYTQQYKNELVYTKY